MAFTTINGIKINYEIAGKGAPLLMFAPGGFGSTIARWTAAGGKREWQEMDGLATLAKHFKVIAYDRREAGFSGGRIEPLTWDHYVLEAKALLEFAGEKKALILGSCMGAALATAFAERHPQMCLGLYLHWPVGGYRWLLKGQTFFRRHMDFVRAHGFAAVVRRAPEKRSFWEDAEIGPWGPPTVHDAEFAAQYVKQDMAGYFRICEQTRDILFNDTQFSGAGPAALMKMDIPAFIQSGNDSSHAHSAAWATKELLPDAELWDVLPPHQNGGNTLEQILKFKVKLGL
ncbi:MAG: alpha/beta hydrolase [Burkholderiales bacterium]|nr:alpha/beta hydrolase [Burkholderiales bacterium]